MKKTQIVRCSNCGSQAVRRYFVSDEVIYHKCPHHLVVQTECSKCDYLMVMCSLSGSVVEAYASGIEPAAAKSQISQSKVVPLIKSISV